MLGGCIKTHEYFVSIMDSHIGKSDYSLINTFGAPVREEPFDSYTLKYVYEMQSNGESGEDAHCIWYALVDKWSREVKQWDFISSPEKCYFVTRGL